MQFIVGYRFKIAPKQQTGSRVVTSIQQPLKKDYGQFKHGQTYEIYYIRILTTESGFEYQFKCEKNIIKQTFDSIEQAEKTICEMSGQEYTKVTL